MRNEHTQLCAHTALMPKIYFKTMKMPSVVHISITHVGFQGFANGFFLSPINSQSTQGADLF